MGRTEDAQAASARADREAAEAETRAAQAERDRQAARQAAEANPTPENIEAAQRATRTATEAQQDAAAKRRAATAAADAVIDARMADLSAQIEAAQSDLHAAKGNPNGINLLTDLNWDWHTVGKVSRLVSNNFAVRVVGAEKKVSMGVFFTFVGGAKVETCLASKHGVIVGYERKYVLGSNVNYFGGAKIDIVGGAKRDLVYGSKHEMHAGAKISVGPSDNSKEPIRDLKRNAWATISSSVKGLLKKREEKTGGEVIKSSKMLEDLKDMTLTAASVLQKASELTEKISTAKATGSTFVLRSTGMIRFEASGSSLLEGGGSQIQLGGSATIKGPGASVNIDGSGVSTGANTKIC